MNAFYIILTGSLVAVSCGLLGVYLILRKMAMIGDAISHAVLPGIVIAYLISGSRESVWMLTGAAIFGLFTTIIIEFLHKKAHLQTDASIGVIFTWLFAIGVILLTLLTGKIDLDQDCVLYGEIAYIPLDTWILPSGVNMGPMAVYILSGLLILVILFIFFGYKELLVTTFDPSFALTIGISTTLWHYFLMGMVSMATVASFEAVGAILVVAFLIGPPAIAYLLTNDLVKMILITAISGILISISGYYLAVLVNGSISGAMATMTGVLFMITLLFSPLQGILVKKTALKLKA